MQKKIMHYLQLCSIHTLYLPEEKKKSQHFISRYDRNIFKKSKLLYMKRMDKKVQKILKFYWIC